MITRATITTENNPIRPAVTRPTARLMPSPAQVSQIRAPRIDLRTRVGIDVLAVELRRTERQDARAGGGQSSDHGRHGATWRGDWAPATYCFRGRLTAHGAVAAI